MAIYVISTYRLLNNHMRRSLKKLIQNVYTCCNRIKHNWNSNTVVSVK